MNSMYVGGGGEAPRGSVSSIALDQTDRGGDAKHALVSRAMTGVMPVGLAITPDGRWVVTANLERSTPGNESPSQGFFSSLTLLRFDAKQGRLERVGDYPQDAVLPEGIVFDNSSRFIAVTTFDHIDDRRVGGAVEFWRLSGDHADPSRVGLVKTNVSVPVARGAHSISIAR